MIITIYHLVVKRQYLCNDLSCRRFGIGVGRWFAQQGGNEWRLSYFGNF
jgi:hypothetical protein